MFNEIFKAALSIEEPWYIAKIEFNKDDKQLDIFMDFHKGSTFFSGLPDDENKYKAYDTVEKTWRHLNFFEHECYLHCRTPRIKLKKGGTKMISPPWSGRANGFTLLFESLIIQLCSHMPVAAVSRLIKVNDDRLWRLLEKYVLQARAHEEYTDLKAVGVDETSQKKGHGYITLFVDLDKRKTVYVSEGKNHKTLDRFSRDLRLHGGNADQISDFSCDMSPAFIKGINKCFSNAQITFDKFHVLKIINKAVDQIRKNEVNTHSILRKTKFIWLKNRENYTAYEQEKYETISLSKLNLRTFRALRIRENFQAIYNASSEEEFIRLLKNWYFWVTHCRIEPLIKVAKTIKKHWDGIVSWFRSKINNGILEGLNSVIQAAKAKARGYKNFRYFRTIVYLITGNIDISKVNKFYVKI